MQFTADIQDNHAYEPRSKACTQLVATQKPTLQLVEVHNFTLAMRNSDTDIKNSTLLPCSWLQDCVTARLLFSYASAFGSFFLNHQGDLSNFLLFDPQSNL